MSKGPQSDRRKKKMRSIQSQYRLIREKRSDKQREMAEKRELEARRAATPSQEEMEATIASLVDVKRVCVILEDGLVKKISLVGGEDHNKTYLIGKVRLALSAKFKYDLPHDVKFHIVLMDKVR